jgi:glycosyltransferase involved in cell wall biosynthesis
MRVRFVPYWAGENPYQRLLADELARLGVDVDGERADVLPRAFGRVRPDVLHLHWLTPLYRGAGAWRNAVKIGVLALRLWVLRLRGTRIVWTAHNLTGHETAGAREELVFAGLVARVAHVVIVHGASAEEILRRRLRLGPSHRIVVIPHGSYVGAYPAGLDAAEARARLALDDSATVFLFLGQIRRYKGLQELLEAFRGFPDPQCRLVIAGRPAGEGALETLEAAARSDARVLLVPRFVPDDEVQVYMAAADVVVLPFLDVLTSGSVVLAMSFGKPCLSRRVGCVEDAIGDAGGIYCGPGADGLRAGLAQARAAKPRWPAMGAANRRRAEDWSFARVAARTLAAYGAAPED